MPYVVNVALTVDTEDPDEAAAFVRAQLAEKLAGEDAPWQAERPDLLPRWQVTSVRRVARLDERGGPVG